MMALASITHKHWRAVERDIISLGYHVSDIGTSLTLSEVISVVVSAQPGTAVHHAMSGGWSKEAELLANLSEQQAGVFGINARYQRPGVDSPQPVKPQGEFESMPAFQGVMLDAATPDEFTKKLRERQKTVRAKGSADRTSFVTKGPQ